MAILSGDPLLKIARILLTLAMGLATLVAAGLAIALPAIFVARDKLLIEIAEEAGRAIAPDMIPALAGLIGVGLAITALAFLFLRHLRRIVDSVAQGDPFAPVNAERLEAMGWLTLAIQLTSLFAEGVSHWVANQVDPLSADFDISLGGLFLALVLFILARVFRKGAEMRDELEGTV
ncbi:MAG: DUF2975 domain-containing protein [Novosphingobium sp.]